MNPVLLILVAIILVVVLNLLLVASVKNHAKNTGKSTVRNMLSAIREPFQQGDSDLEELSSMVDQLDPNLISPEDKSKDT